MSGQAFGFDQLLAWVAAIGWLFLLGFRGNFWRIESSPPPPRPSHWPEVVAIVPARDEAAVIGESVGSLLAQEYPGKFSVVVVDDGSSDGTADVACAVAEAADKGDRLRVATGSGPPDGWTGKLWAQSQGIAHAEADHPQADLWLLTDADIVHAPNELEQMTARLLAGDLDMASLMVRLSTESRAEQAVVPAFVFFFRLLFPFAWVNDPRKSTAAAAGGYMLVRRRALDSAGGLEAIKGALIDDCSLAALLKAHGSRIWLGLSRRTVSRRLYPSLGGLWTMIARSAYTQLKHSPLLLSATMLGIGIGFLVPPVLAVAGGTAAVPAAVAWVAMIVVYLPMLRFYEVSWLWGPLLPLVVLVYMGATLDSARRHWLGRGGQWKGRIQGGRQQRKSA
jgi:hopene-associated glycosyltransferase HpnB